MNIKKIKIYIYLITFSICLYMGIYCFISSMGDYIPTQSGEIRWDFGNGPGLSTTDIIQWQPRFAFAQRFRQIDSKYTFRADVLGTLYLPLILMDQKYLHKTIRFIPLEKKEEDKRDSAQDFSFNMKQSERVNQLLIICGSFLTLCCIMSLIYLVKAYYNKMR